MRGDTTFGITNFPGSKNPVNTYDSKYCDRDERWKGGPVKLVIRGNTALVTSRYSGQATNLGEITFGLCD